MGKQRTSSSRTSISTDKAHLPGTDTPRQKWTGVLPSSMRLAPEYRYSDVEARMSRSVSRTAVLPVPVCPTVRYEALPVLPEFQLRSNQTARCDEWTSLQLQREFSSCFLADVANKCFVFWCALVSTWECFYP